MGIGSWCKFLRVEEPLKAALGTEAEMTSESQKTPKMSVK